MLRLHPDPRGNADKLQQVFSNFAAGCYGFMDSRLIVVGKLSTTMQMTITADHISVRIAAKNMKITFFSIDIIHPVFPRKITFDPIFNPLSRYDITGRKLQ